MQPINYLKPSLTLASVSMLRMFGFFLLMPILSFLANKLQYASQFNIGMALGIYGLIQAFFYFPLGILSDKIGRKPVIYCGLLLLFLGAVLAANTSNVYILILARAIQGIGAISSVLSAFTADIIPIQHRTKAMMMIGIGVGISFPMSLIAAPILYNNFGQSGIFYTVALSSITAGFFIYLLPNIKNNNQAFLGVKKSLNLIIHNKPMHPWLIGVFFLHILSMMFFYIISFILQSKNIILADQWKFYLPILTISFILAAKIIKNLEKQKRNIQISYISIVCLAIANLGLIFTSSISIYSFSILVLIYFTGFNILEIFQPSILSKLSNAQTKGATMGVYYSIQSLGMFCGAVSAGIASRFADIYGMDKAFIIFSLSLLFVVLWIAYSIKNSKNNLLIKG